MYFEAIKIFLYRIVSLLVIASMFMGALLFPSYHILAADTEPLALKKSDQIMILESVFVAQKNEEISKVAYTITAVATAYSSTPDQTDSTPFITANGMYVYDGLIAANFLPLGTKVKIPEHFGDKIFSVNDRMNARYGSGRIDIWMKTREEAKVWGVKRLRLEILR